MEKSMVVLIFLLGIISIGIGIAAWDPAAHSVSHNSADVKVTISGTDYSLQEAIDSGLLSGSGKVYDYYNIPVTFIETEAKPAQRYNCSDLGVGYDYIKVPADCGVSQTQGDLHIGFTAISIKDNGGCGINITAGANPCDGDECTINMVVKCQKDPTRIVKSAGGMHT